MATPAPDAWLRGPIAGIPALLQPAAHAFVLAREDVDTATSGLSHEQLWSRPNGITPLGFHLAHLAGATSRLMTYATGQPLSDAQKAFLLKERAVMDTKPQLSNLLHDWYAAYDAAMAQLAATPEASLAEVRTIGKAQLPTSVIGAIFHAAEHAARHTGQIVTTAKLVR
ncbi:MAG TPA: DinB family protein [Vicinamibacterales bacterium]|nr:DinB family protein [Vicinamibacterales bacterium]